MGIMEKVGAKIATKYGIVTQGKHSGCQIALGNEPGKKVEVANHFEQIIFVDGTEEKGRYDIIRDICGLVMCSHDERYFQFMLLFANDEKLEFNLEIRQEDKPVTGMLKNLLGQKTTMGSSEAEKMELQYRGVKVFVQSVGIRMVARDLRFFRDLFQEKGILDEKTNKIIEIYLEKALELDEE